MIAYIGEKHFLNNYEWKDKIKEGNTQDLINVLEEIEKEARSFVRILRHTGMDAKIQMVSCESQIGGGSLPLERMESRAVAIQPNGMSVAEMEEKMRHLEIPIIPRTINDSICLDVRTIERKDYKMIAAELAELLGKKEER